MIYDKKISKNAIVFWKVLGDETTSPVEMMKGMRAAILLLERQFEMLEIINQRGCGRGCRGCEKTVKTGRCFPGDWVSNYLCETGTINMMCPECWSESPRATITCSKCRNQRSVNYGGRPATHKDQCHGCRGEHDKDYELNRGYQDFEDRRTTV